MTTKRLQAITGDLITISHPTLALEHTATSSVTVLHEGTTYSITSKPPHLPHDLPIVTAEYRIGGGVLRVSETVDTLQIGASAIRYHNVWETESGSLQIVTHKHHEEGLELLEAIAPEQTPLGVRIQPMAGIEVVVAPGFLFDAAALGLLQISPLTKAGLAALPDWQGTPVVGGELFAANLSRSVPYLILVTDTARVDIMLNDDDVDTPTELAAQLEVTWKP